MGWTQGKQRKGWDGNKVEVGRKQVTVDTIREWDLSG